MWVFLSDAMLSIVQHRDDPDYMMVRARLLGDIECVFPDAKIIETPKADYRWRAVVPREEVAEAIAKEVEMINYDNFKNSVPKGHADRHNAYFGVWVEMHDAQAREAGTQPWRSYEEPNQDHLFRDLYEDLDTI